MDGRKFATLAVIMVIVVSIAATPIPRAQAAIWVPTRLYTPVNSWSGSSPLAYNLPQAPTNGNTLIACIVVGSSGASAVNVASITEAGVTWTYVIRGTSTGASKPVSEIWIGAVAAGASASVSIATGAGLDRVSANIAEYAGTLTADKTAHADTQSGTTYVTGTTAATVNNQEVIIGCISTILAQNTPTNGFTLIDGAIHGIAIACGYYEKQVTATATYSTGCTTAATTGSGSIAAFKSTSAPTAYHYNLASVYEDGSTLATLALQCTNTAVETLTITSTAGEYYFTSRPYAFSWTAGAYTRSIYPLANTGTYTPSVQPGSGTVHGYLWMIRDFTGQIQNGYIVIKRSINSVLQIVDMEPIHDLVSGTPATMQDGGQYHIYIWTITGSVAYDYGIMMPLPAQLTNTITIKTISFTQSAQVSYHYIVAEATRPAPTQIVSNYNDTMAGLSDTTNIALTIRYLNGTTAYSASSASNAHSFTWNGASSTQDYTVQMVGTSTVFGDVSYFMTLPKAGPAYSAPLNLGLFGATGTTGLTANALPFMITLAVFAAFSVATLGVGAVMGVGMAAIMKAIGWWNPDSGLLAFAFCLAVIVYLAESRRWNR